MSDIINIGKTEELVQKKKYDFCIGSFDKLDEQIIKKIKEEASNAEVYGVGVYSNDILEDTFFTYPLNDLKTRMKTAKSIESVDFVFSIDTNKENEIKEIIQKEFSNYINNKKLHKT